VHSSTSSSNDRLPSLPYRRSWTLAIILSVAVLGGWETLWRALGYHRNPPAQDPRQWSLLRKTASRAGDSSVVLIGTSRVIVDFDTRAFYEMTRLNAVQLGIEGKSPLAVLANLAEDHSFRGTVICDFHEVFIYATEGTRNPRMNLSAADFVKAYTDRSFLTELLPDRVDSVSHRLLTQTLVFQMPELSPTSVIHHAVHGELPPKQQDAGAVVQDGTTISLFGRQLNDDELQKLRQHFVDLTNNCISKTDISANLPLVVAEKVDGMVKRIEGRGGNVIFVGFPMGGRIWELNESTYPKKDFWDVLASHSTATWIHFRDYPELSSFNLPDWSHLDPIGASQFTRSLTAIMLTKKLLPSLAQ
jgi:hypothetical protein